MLEARSHASLSFSAGEGASLYGGILLAAPRPATAIHFPSAVPNLIGTRVTTSARLDWNPEPDVVVYVIYYSFTPGGPYLRAAEVSALTYLHQNQNANGTYYYRVAARSQAGWEGAFSTEVLVDLKK